MPMTISYVEENKPFLSCPCTQSSHDSTFAEVYREGRTDWVSIKLQWRQAFFLKVFIWFYTPRVCNHNHSKSTDLVISIFIHRVICSHKTFRLSLISIFNWLLDCTMVYFAKTEADTVEGAEVVHC